MLDKREKSILYPDPEADQAQNLIIWSLAKYLSFHKIWFKSVNNFLKYILLTDRQTHTHTHTHTHR